MAMHEPQKLGSVLQTFSIEAKCSVGEHLIHKQKDLRKIVPVMSLGKQISDFKEQKDSDSAIYGSHADFINLDLAIEWA